MERLDVLSKNDLVSLLELSNSCYEIEDMGAFRAHLDRLKTLVHFDCSVCTYVDFKALSKNSDQSVKSLNFGFPQDLLDNYFNRQLWKTDIPVLAFLKTFHIQNFQECIDLYNEGDVDAVEASLRDHGLKDGWVHGVPYIHHP